MANNMDELSSRSRVEYPNQRDCIAAINDNQFTPRFPNQRAHFQDRRRVEAAVDKSQPHPIEVWLVASLWVWYPSRISDGVVARAAEAAMVGTILVAGGWPITLIDYGPLFLIDPQA